MQPTYLPGCSMFGLIDRADTHVLLDTVQFERHSWQNRNRVRARDGSVVWLTVPVRRPHRRPLCEIEIVDDGWRLKHWRTLEAAYGHAPFWGQAAQWLRIVYGIEWRYLTDLTSALTTACAYQLGVRTTRVVRASALGATSEDRVERVDDLLRLTGATTLVNTAGAKGLLDGLSYPVEWLTYTPAPYSQDGQPWMPDLSVVDLVAWHGPAALDVIRAGYPPPA